MKRITIMTLLIMTIVSFAIVGFADNSPPGVEIGVSYELPEGAQINVEIQVAQVWQSIQLNNVEARIAVYPCDLKCWPNSVETFNIYTPKIFNDLGIIREANNINTDFGRHCGQMETLNIPENQHNENRFKTEVLSMFENSKGDRYSARNEVT